MDIENLDRMRQLLIDMHRNEGVVIIFDTKLAKEKGYTSDEILLALDIIDRNPDVDEVMRTALLGYYQESEILPRIYYIREVGLLFFYFYSADYFYYGFREQVPQCIDDVIATLKCNFQLLPSIMGNYIKK